MVGGGHNGLVAACYLARAGVRVQVLEQSDRLGGGSRTEELIPGFRFNTHSAAHNILNATDIAGELHLHEVGLRYREMDPFSVAVFSDGRIVRFHRSVEATVDSLAEVDRAEADRYAAWMREAMPVVSAARWGLEAGAGHRRRLRTAPRVTWGAAQALVRGRGPAGLGRTLLLPYGRMLRERFATDLVRAPVSAFAVHASASPEAPGGAIRPLAGLLPPGWPVARRRWLRRARHGADRPVRTARRILACQRPGGPHHPRGARRDRSGHRGGAGVRGAAARRLRPERRGPSRGPAGPARPPARWRASPAAARGLP